jgi:ParB family chromosome partitioning protein
MTLSNTTLFPTAAAVGDIRVGHRHRSDLGDLVPLIKSIQEVGLLHPLVVTPDMQLVAGARRLAAVKELGWKEVPVRVVEGLDDAVAALRAERDENTCRKDFTPSEAVAIGQALEELERVEAKKRQREHGGTAPGKAKNTPGNLPEVNGDARDKVAAAVGMSGRTYDKAKDVAEAAEKEPEKYGDLVQQMDQTGKVDPAHKELKRRGGKPPKPGKKKPITGKGKKEEWLWVAGAVIELNQMGEDGQLDRYELSLLSRLPKKEQNRLVKAGAAAIKAKATEMRWVDWAPGRGSFCIWHETVSNFDPGAEVSEGARREALEKLNAALEDLQRVRDTITGWVAALEEKLPPAGPEEEPR